MCVGTMPVRQRGRIPCLDDHADGHGGEKRQGDPCQDVALAKAEPRPFPTAGGQFQRGYAFGPCSSLTTVGHTSASGLDLPLGRTVFVGVDDLLH